MNENYKKTCITCGDYGFVRHNANQKKPCAVCNSDAFNSWQQARNRSMQVTLLSVAAAPLVQISVPIVHKKASVSQIIR